MSGERSYFDELAASFASRYDERVSFRVRRALVLDEARKALEHLPGERPRCFDLGCGSGVLAVALAELGFDVDCVDSSAEMIAQARARAERAGREVRFHHESLDDFLARTDAPPSLVLVSSVFEYHPHPESTLRRVTELLRPHGRLVFSVPNRASVLRRAEDVVSRVAPGRLSYRRQWHNRLDVADYRRLVSDAGLRVDHIRYFGLTRPLDMAGVTWISRARLIGTMALLSCSRP